MNTKQLAEDIEAILMLAKEAAEDRDNDLGSMEEPNGAAYEPFRSEAAIRALPEVVEALKMALTQITQDNNERRAGHRDTEWQVRACLAKVEGGKE